MRLILILIVIGFYGLLLGKDMEESLFNKVGIVDGNSDLYLGFVPSYIRYPQDFDPSDLPMETTYHLKAWKGEKVNAQLILNSALAMENCQVELDDLADNKGNKIPAENIHVGFVKSVWADGLNKEGGGCGIQIDQDSVRVPDLIDNSKSVSIIANQTQPIWLTIDLPTSIPAGTFEGVVKLKDADRKISELAFSIEVIDRTLPDPKNWEFHLDLWQNPYSIARYHHVEPWSDAHLNMMLPYMDMLANAGQKVITASIIHDPWNGQTYDIYGSMIKWIKKENGEWMYDYDIFDKWVSYMMSVGIDKQINCYSMIPWNHTFSYFDEALGKDTLLVAKPGTLEYEKHWQPMLEDFANHLKEKGWFEKTTIAMDERPLEDMKNAIALIKETDKHFKISLAGYYHPEIESDIYDYSIVSYHDFDSESLSSRKTENFISTYYTCCMEGYPNTFTFSPPAESTWLAWYAANKGYDGYLRWAYNSWPEDPMEDSRFGTWSSGDTFLVYPGYKSSVRFEMLIEGIQDFEKIRILESEFERLNKTQDLKKLKDAVRSFEISSLEDNSANEMVNQAREVLDSF